ncbi:MAG: tyrosine-type recombinase/integrase [Acidobacteriia bacterium]|nr:tyrosine-type recombinase/integrase [Terriglobia bacterium]
MANKEVNLTKRVQTTNGSRFCRVVLSKNGRVLPDMVYVDGKPEKHPEGRYYLEWHDGRKRIRRSAGSDANAANTERIRREQLLNNKALGIKVAESEEGNSTLLSAAAAAYLEDIKLTKKPKTLAAYSGSLAYFLESCTKQRVQDIERRDMLQFSAFLRDVKKLEPRTVWNKFLNVVTFLKAQGIRGLVGKNDWPQFVEDEPEVYERADLDKFFKACDAKERLWFEFFLMTGMREQEVMYCTWPDINLTRGVVAVRYKKEFGFSPKAYKPREIPIPAKLLASLKQHKAKANTACSLLFPTKGCKPKMNFLDECKAIAGRAGLNPADFWLHKFRATFATWSLWNGVDLRTVQLWLGHSGKSGMESTLRYLKPSENEAVRDKVNSTFA